MAGRSRTRFCLQIIAKVIDNMASIGSMDMDSRVGLVQLGEPLKEMPKIKLSKSIDLDDTLAQMRKLTHSSGKVEKICFKFAVHIEDPTRVTIYH